MWGGIAATIARNPAPPPQVALADGAAFDPVTHSWTPMPAAPLAARLGVAAVWTGADAIFWGGEKSGGTHPIFWGEQGRVPLPSASDYFSDGAAYDPSTGAWARLPTSPLSPRSSPMAVWTGSEVIIFGGLGPNGTTLLDGATYNPTAATWNRLPPLPAGPGRPFSPAAVWTGRKLLVLTTSVVTSHPTTTTGGLSAVHHLLSWSPGARTWRQLADPPLGDPVNNSQGLWTGSTVLFTGGTSCAPSAPSTSCAMPALSTPIPTYNVSTDSWGSTPGILAAGLPVWTGRALVMLNQGAGSDSVLDPATGRWTALPQCPIQALGGANAVWTGNEVLVWAGGAGAGFENAALAAALVPR